MAIIDQRILIPARQELVWSYLSDLTKNAEWQADCQSVSFVTTKHDGVGARWRSGSDRGKDAVLEVTSWYNGLGYEYIYIDGAPFNDNKCRLRLQEIPEGTVVQWTVTFEGGGMFGGGRSVRQFDAMMAASLKQLYKQIKAFNSSEALAARSLMRDAPDVEARAAYKPRHPSSLTGEAGGPISEDAVLLPSTDEPAVAAEDAGLVQVIDLTAEPPVAVDDTRPRPAVTDEPSPDARFAPPPERVTADTTDIEPSEASAESAATPAEAAPDKTAAAMAAAVAAAELPPADPQGKSIWEIFGVERPEAVATPVSAPAPSAEATAEEPREDVLAEAAASDNVPPTVREEPEPEAAQPSAEETIGLDAVVLAAPTIPALATIIAPVPDQEVPAAVSAVPTPAIAPASAPQTVRVGLRITERRALVKLKRPN